MTTPIIDDVRRYLQVYDEVFDDKLLIHINTAIAELYDLGADEFRDLIVDDTTVWPTMPYSETTKGLMRGLLCGRVKNVFDTTGSTSVQKVLDTHLISTSERIMTNIAEYNRDLEAEA